MTDTTLFKRAYVRGLNAELARAGLVAYPTKEAADHAADFVADRSGMPDPFTQPQHVTHKVAADLCGLLKQASDTLCAQAGGYSPELSKTAAAADPYDMAAHDCATLMQKVAYETEAPNTAEEAARHNEAAALDASHRPAGYAVSGVGNYVDMGKGRTGTEEPQPRGDGVSGVNSPTENSMKSAAARLAAKVAGSYAGTPGAPPANTLAAAAKNNEAAELDQANRPQGYANVGVNASKVTVPAGAVTGHEQPVARANHPEGSNTATKAAAERLHKVASRALPFLFSDLTEVEKVAHVRALAKLGSFGQAQYLHQMYGAYGLDKTAALAHAQNYLKIAEDEGDEANEGEDDDTEVAKALQEAAEEIEEGKKKEEGEEAMKEAAFVGLQNAIANIRR
jgi:hypothetical protein